MQLLPLLKNGSICLIYFYFFPQEMFWSFWLSCLLLHFQSETELKLQLKQISHLKKINYYFYQTKLLVLISTPAFGGKKFSGKMFQTAWNLKIIWELETWQPTTSLKATCFKLLKCECTSMQENGPAHGKTSFLFFSFFFLIICKFPKAS